MPTMPTPEEILKAHEKPQLDTALGVRFAQILAAYDFVKDLPPDEAKKRWQAMSPAQLQALCTDGFKNIFFASTVLSLVETAEEYAATK